MIFKNIFQRLIPQSHCHESTGDSVRMLAICTIRMWERIMENQNAPGVDNLLKNRPTRINTVQITSNIEQRGTKNNELEPIQIRVG